MSPKHAPEPYWTCVPINQSVSEEPGRPLQPREGAAMIFDESGGTCFKFRSVTEYDEQVVVDFPKTSPMRG